MGVHLTPLTRRTYDKHNRDSHVMGCILPTAFLPVARPGRQKAAVAAQCDLATVIVVVSGPAATCWRRPNNSVGTLP